MIPEPFEANSFLHYQGETTEYAYKSQQWFIRQFELLQLQARVLTRIGTVLQDHSVYDAHNVFNESMRELGWLSEQQYCQLRDRYHVAERHLRAPDVVIRLRAPEGVLLERIRARDRPFERSLDATYVSTVSSASNRWWDQWTRSPILTIDSARVDFRTTAGADEVVNMLERAITR